MTLEQIQELKFIWNKRELRDFSQEEEKKNETIK